VGTRDVGTLDVERLTSHLWRFIAAALMLVAAACTLFTTSQVSIPGERTGAQARPGADSSAQAGRGAQAGRSAQAGRGADTGPLSPGASLASFRLDPDLEIRVFAAEPHVRDPVDLVFDAHGRAYVAEMLGRVVSESPGILSLRSLVGDRRVLRSRIATIRQEERSLMPPEAAGELSPQQLADVIAFLRAARE